jgi:hypothetical protein
MNMNRLWKMLTRMLMRKAMKTGIDLATRGGGSRGPATPADRAQAKTAKETGQKARRAARIGRRMMK